jgi:hypothetical protein
MISRRIKEHVKAQNWFAVGVDFLIVVVGILLAFQITEWAQARSDRAREMQIIGDLLADLDIDRAHYSFEISKLSSFPAGRIDRLWSDVVLGFHPTPSTSTYDTMVGSGDIKVIRDRRLIREIQAYHNLAQSVNTQNEKLLSIREDVVNFGASLGLAPYLEMPAEEYFRLVAGDPQLAAVIRIMATFAIYHHGEIKTADAKAAELQMLLGEYLGR